MKRFFAILLALLMTAALCACDGGEAPKKEAYGATVKGISVEIDADAAAVLGALGAWSSYDESPSCAFEGLDKIYGYGAFDLLTYPLDGKDYVSGIYLNDDTYTTRKGVRVGDAKESVTAAYGAADEETASYLRYAAEGMTLTFLIKDGKVTNIQYVKNT